MSDKIYSITEFNRVIKEYLEENERLQGFFLKGEIAGITYYKSGHLYFTLKDIKSQIKCVSFNYKLKKIQEDLKTGDYIKIFGDVGFYENRGDFQILVRFIEKENKLGELYEKLEKLKLKMKAKGMFSELFKKPLPNYPKAIGVVTAYTGAAFHDIINTTRKRFKNIDIYIYSAKVQGTGSANEIVKGIKTLNNIDRIDLIIAGRGGGSIEDLWAFNEEKVAKAFFDSKKPIISAVGHEVDNLLSDLTADVRASTPTQAIEIAIPVKKEILSNLLERKKRLNSSLNRLIKEKKDELIRVKNNYIFKTFNKKIEEKNYLLVLKEDGLNKLMERKLSNLSHRLDIRLEKIIASNPILILKKGYSITKKNDKILKEKKNICVGDRIETILNDGVIISRIEEIK